MNASELRRFLLSLFDLQLEQPRAQDAHRRLAILKLGALCLAAHHNAGGQVCESDRGAHLVHVLAARATGAEHVHLDVFRSDVDLDRVVHDWHYLYRGERGMSTMGLIERREAYKPMHAPLRAEVAVDVL